MKRQFARVVLLLVVLSTGVFLAPVRAADEPPRPKVTFDLTVSLEWQPGTGDNLQTDLSASGCDAKVADASYVNDLVEALKRTSAYLYSYSQGQMAFGKVLINTGSANWTKANIRILASNAYRPTALVGGNVAAPMTYTSSVTGRKQTFYPGKIFLGRLWNGLSARCGAWSSDEGWRTVGHEWAHYALFLYDEYYNQTTMAAQYCTGTGRPLPDIPAGDAQIPLTDSLMAYQYRADQLWLKSAPMPASCAGTPQMHLHGEADWKTVKRFFPTVVPPVNLVRGPIFEGSPAATAFVPTVVQPAAPPTNTSSRVNLGQLPVAGLLADSYLFRPNADGSPARIIGQGQTLVGGKDAHLFWGVQPLTKDRAAVIVQDPVSGARWAYPKDYRATIPLSTSTETKIIVPTSSWRPGMTITPIVQGTSTASEVTGLRVTVNDCTLKAKRIQVSYCPAGGACSTPVDMNQAGGLFTYTFGFPQDSVQEPPARYGYIYVRSLLTGEEMTAWYQLGGGVGPAIIDGHAPMVDGQVDVSPAPSANMPADKDTRVLLSSAQTCTIIKRTLPAGVIGIIGSPTYIQPVLTRAQGAGWGRDDPALRVRLSYDQTLLDQLGIKETKLVLLRLETPQQWVQVPTLAQSLPLDWIAGAPRQFRGAGETYAIGYK